MALPNKTTISEEEDFYGYLYGIHADIDDDGDNATLYAYFYYNGEKRRYIIPDYDLYQVLKEQFDTNAFEFFENKCLGVGKLWIAKKENGWWADLP